MSGYRFCWRRIISGELAEATLATGKSDLVAMTRAIIADPDLPNKLRAGQRVRPCIGINQGCIGRLYSGYPIVCSVNPAIRDPQLDVLEPTDRPRRVVVVGGGVAGMKAAGHAARRGHQVTLLERGDQLGGRSLLNATHGWRPSWHLYLDYLSAELQSRGVKIICGVQATVVEVLSHDPETVVVATGSQLRDWLSAVDGPTLVDADEVIAQPPEPGDNSEAVIIDDDCHLVAPTAIDALVNQLGDELRRLHPELDVRLAGDAHAPRNFDAATAEGALVGAGIL